MSTVQKKNFEPTSDLMLIQRRDLPLADGTLLNPNNAVALTDGEWVVPDANNKLVRASTIGSVGNAATVKSYPVWSEKGRSDTQSASSKKATYFYLGSWEADTRIFDASAVVGGGAAITYVGQPLKVATITIGSRNYSGLVGAASTDVIVATVARLPSNNGGKLKITSANR